MNARVGIQHAQERLCFVLDGLTAEEEYLREALEEQLHGIQVLLDKVAVEEALLRDREALLSDPSAGLGEHLDDDSRPEE
jgi:hypothetical protein